MAVVKVLGLYSTAPAYHTGGFIIYVCFILPILPTLFITVNGNDSSKWFFFVYLPIYLVQTFIFGKYIVKVGLQWTLKEYDAMTPDQVTFPFIFAITCHGLFHFIIFKVIVLILNLI